MKIYRLLALLLLIASYVKAQDTLDIYRKLAEIAVIDQKVMIPMRDGVRLATDIYRPKGGGKHPLILSRTPYNFNSWVDGKMTSRSFQEAYETCRTCDGISAPIDCCRFMQAVVSAIYCIRNL